MKKSVWEEIKETCDKIDGCCERIKENCRKIIESSKEGEINNGNNSNRSK